MTKASGVLASLVCRLGVKSPKSSRGCKGIGAPKMTRGIGVSVAALCALVGALAFSAAPALAAAPESPKAEPPTEVKASTATFNGILNPKAPGEAGATYEYLYKATKAPTKAVCEEVTALKTTPGISLGAEGEMLPGEPVAGLIQNTEYVVCLRIENMAKQATVSPPVAFKTALPPETPETTTPAKAITATTATVEGVLNPKAKAPIALEYDFAYKASATECEPEGLLAPEPPTKAAGKPKEAAAPQKLTALEPNTTYAFCLRAHNAAEEVAAGNVATFTTLKSKPTVISETATPSGFSEARLEATVNPSNEPTECHFGYGLTNAKEHVLPCEAPTLEGAEQTTGLTIKGLTQHTLYRYRVILKNTTGLTEPTESEFTSGTPETPAALQAKPVEATTATLHGTLNSTHEGLPGSYEFIYNRSATECEGPEQKTATGLATGTSPEPVENEVTELLPGNTYAFCLRATNEASETATSAPITFKALDATPEVPAEFVTGVSAEGAEFAGQVLPGGLDTSYRFEYGTTIACGSSVPAHATETGNGSVVVHVETGPVERLSPATTYHYHLVAVNSADPAGFEGPDQTFTTQAAGASFTLPDGRRWEQVTPVDKHGANIEPIDSEGGLVQAAQLGGAITFTATAPTEPDAEANPALNLSQIIATRSPGGGWASRDISVPRTSEPTGVHIGQITEYLSFSADLSSAFVEPLGLTPQLAENADEQAEYLREDLLAPSGQHYTSLANSENTPPGTHYGDGNLAYAEYGATSRNLKHIVLTSRVPLASGDSSGGLYEWSAGAFTPVSAIDGELDYEHTGVGNGYGSTQGGSARNAVSEDGEQVFWTTDQYSPSGPHLYVRENASRPASPLAHGAASGTGSLSEGSDVAIVLHTNAGAFQVGQTVTEEGALIAEGTTITEVTPEVSGDLKLTLSAPAIGNSGPAPVRLGASSACTIAADACTVQVDSPRGQITPAPQERPLPMFLDATPNGERVYFTEERRLTADATAEYQRPDLYEYNTSTGALNDLTVNTATGTGAGAGGQLIGTSENGEYVYFVAAAALAPGAHAEGFNVYVEHITAASRTIALVATLTSSDANDGGGDQAILADLTARVSPSGRFLAFMSAGSLTGYDNVDAVSGQRDQEVFEYDAVTSGLSCASCDPTGARPHGVYDPVRTEREEQAASGQSEGIGLLVDRPKIWEGSWLAGSIPSLTTYRQDLAVYQSRFLDDSGRLFFDAADSLVPQDSNGKEDVYEYEPEEVGSCTSTSGTASVAYKSAHSFLAEGHAGSEPAGCVGLISSGKSSKESAFLDASETGDEAFFLTAAKLTGSDLDDSDDIYDAHVCSAESCSNAELTSAPPCATADSCRAAPTPQPAVFGTAPSATFTGPGNLTPTPAMKPKPPTRAQLLTAALRACLKKHGKRRLNCQRAAHKRYPANAHKTALTRRRPR
jgi:hypothetical protein